MRVCRIFYRCVDWNCAAMARFWRLPSHLLQMRGLKLLLLLVLLLSLSRIFYRCVDWNIFIGLGYARPLVASFTDAWIETRCCLCEDSCRESHLLQMRGLKLTFAVENSIWKVASFTDAWIETVWKNIYWMQHNSRIFYRCVDWNPKGFKSLITKEVASFTDAWIETVGICNWKLLYSSHLLQMRGLKPYLQKILLWSFCRIFYRCVDWNFPLPAWCNQLRVASFTDAWIET